MQTKCIDHNQKGNKQGYGHSNNERLHRKVFKQFNGVNALAREFKVDPNTIYNIVKWRTHLE